MNDMTPGLRRFVRISDWAMLLYWAVSAFACAGLIVLPKSAMYEGYGLPHIDAWNWSFAPLDLAFAITGLMSVRLAVRGDSRWAALAIVSLALTMCAGGMAISYWAIAGDYSLSWWLPNLALLLFPIIWLPRLIMNPIHPAPAARPV